MTPNWLRQHATFTGPYTVNPQQYIEIHSGAAFQLALQVELVAPNILTTTSCAVVAMTVSMDTELANSGVDHDPVIGISDGKSFVGFYISDKTNVAVNTPCLYLESDIVNKAQTNIKYTRFGPGVTSRDFSSEIKLQFKTCDNWGSCHTEHDQGFAKTTGYQHQLDLTNGLYLDIYRDDVEKYRIKYISVKVDTE